MITSIISVSVLTLIGFQGLLLPIHGENLTSASLYFDSERRFLVSNEDVALHWERICPRSEDAWLAFTKAPMELFIDFSPGYGRSYVELAKQADYSVAFLIASAASSEELQHNVAQHAPQRLGSITQLPAITTGSVGFSRVAVLKQYQDIFKQALQPLGMLCPSLVHVSYLYKGQLSELWAMIQNFHFLVPTCQSKLYVDTNSTHILLAVSDLLDSWQYAEMDYQDLCTECKPATKREVYDYTVNIRMFLFAHPSPTSMGFLSGEETDVPSGAPLPRSSNGFPKHFQQRLQLNLPDVCWAAMTEQAQSVPEPFSILVPWDVLLPPSASAYSLSQLWQYLTTDPRSSTASSINPTHFDDLRLSYMYGLDQEEAQTVLHLRCMAWSQRLYRQWMVMLHEIHAKALEEIHHKGLSWPTAIALQQSLTEATFGLKPYLRFANRAFQAPRQSEDSSQTISFLHVISAALETLLETERNQLADRCADFSFSQYTLLDDLRRVKYPSDHRSSASSSADAPEVNIVGEREYGFYNSNVDDISPPSSRTRRSASMYEDDVEMVNDYSHGIFSAPQSVVEEEEEEEEYDDIDGQSSSSSDQQSRLPPPTPKQHPWIRRPPFEAKEVALQNRSSAEVESCGEPIWCSHMQAMRHQVALWQLQELETKELGEMKYHHSSTLSTRSMSSALNSQRTCANVRLLVYEPLSAKQGIGAMLEQVASAMKYAACLGRVLVLADTDTSQDGTLRKWRLPGCSGALLDCYFHPLSSNRPPASSAPSSEALGYHQCRPTAEELVNAEESVDGLGFADFPLRDERVLILRGMPQVGPCAMCDTTGWPTDSEFFDGLLNTAGYRISKHQEDSTYYISSFLAPVRHLATAAFLKTMLRPRQWLSLVLRQIVSYTLLSPRSPSIPSSRRIETKTKRLLDTALLPNHFLSLHVRYGMKAVEETLHPLAKYMAMVKHKHPLYRDIFVSTETHDVMAQLIR